MPTDAPRYGAAPWVPWPRAYPPSNFPPTDQAHAHLGHALDVRPAEQCQDIVHPYITLNLSLSTPPPCPSPLPLRRLTTSTWTCVCRHAGV